MKIKLHLKRLIVILILFIQLFPSMCYAAVDLKTAQEALISYSSNFAKSEEGKLVTWYDVGASGATWRNNAYIYGAKDPQGRYNGRLYMDCVGWTSFAVHYATGLDCGISGGNMMCFAAPQGNSDRTYFNYYPGSSGYEPGDLIVSPTHIMVYVGNGEDSNGKKVSDLIVHSAYSDHLGADSLAATKYGTQITGYYRFNDKALQEIDKANLNYYGSSVKFYGMSQTLNMSNFYYNGIPDGKYSVTKGFFSMLIDSLLQLMDWIIGLLTMMSRMVFVGWAAIFEWVLNSAVKSIAGGDDLNSVPVSSTEVDSGDNITIDKIIFNKIGIFDVNFFNFNDQDPNLNP